MAPALWVVAKKTPLVVARHLFRVTTNMPGAYLRANPEGVRCKDIPNNLGSSRLNWCFFSHNSDHLISVSRS